MKPTRPANEALRQKGNVIDQRNQQIDPAGKHRVDVNSFAKGSQKQPGKSDADKREGEDNAK